MRQTESLRHRSETDDQPYVSAGYRQYFRRGNLVFRAR